MRTLILIYGRKGTELVELVWSRVILTPSWTGCLSLQAGWSQVHTRGPVQYHLPFCARPLFYPLYLPLFFGSLIFSLRLGMSGHTRPVDLPAGLETTF